MKLAKYYIVCDFSYFKNSYEVRTSNNFICAFILAKDWVLRYTHGQATIMKFDRYKIFRRLTDNYPLNYYPK